MSEIEPWNRVVTCILLSSRSGFRTGNETSGSAMYTSWPLAANPFTKDLNCITWLRESTGNVRTRAAWPVPVLVRCRQNTARRMDMCHMSHESVFATADRFCLRRYCTWMTWFKIMLTHGFTSCAYRWWCFEFWISPIVKYALHDMNAWSHESYM